MLLLLGSSGYVGKAFADYFKENNIAYEKVALADIDYRIFSNLMGIIKSIKPEFIINCAGFTGKPNVDSCETMKSETIVGNIILPLNLANACKINDIPLGHVSSGCIYTGGKIKVKNRLEVISDFTENQFAEYSKLDLNSLIGYSEDDIPNFNFKENNSSFYSGTKALAEELLIEFPKIYQWRLRIPFDNINNPRNYLTKLINYDKVYENINSVTHLGEFAEACVKSYLRKIPFGTYNIVNSNPVKTSQVVDFIKKILTPKKEFIFWESNQEFYEKGANAARSNCVLDNSKLLTHGIEMRDSKKAIVDALSNWNW